MILIHINRYSAIAAIGEQESEMISIHRKPRTHAGATDWQRSYVSEDGVEVEQKLPKSEICSVVCGARTCTVKLHGRLGSGCKARLIQSFNQVPLMGSF